MYPRKLMPDPKGAKRLLSLGCNVMFKKTKIKVPAKIENESDYRPGTHYPKLVEREIWLVRIQVPKELMNDIREGSVDLAGENINLDDLDAAYSDDLDKEGTNEEEMSPGQAPAPGPEMAPGLAGPAPAPGGMM